MNRQAYSLDTLLKEINAHAPHRDKRSDGGIGDARHAATDSDHNPNKAGVWRAYDITNTPKDGLDVPQLATLLARKLGKHPALASGAYVIFNRRIISTNRLTEGWRPYNGLDAHTGHLHLSVATAASGYDSRQAWNLWGDQRIEDAKDLLLKVTKDATATHQNRLRAVSALDALK